MLSNVQFTYCNMPLIFPDVKMGDIPIQAKIAKPFILSFLFIQMFEGYLIFFHIFHLPPY